MPVSVLIADNSETVRHAIRMLLANHPEVELVGEAADFAEMAQTAKRLKPEVIIVDLSILDCAPSDFRSQLAFVPSRLIAVSLAYDVDAMLLAASLGISVLLEKAKLSIELVPAILGL